MKPTTTFVARWNGFWFGLLAGMALLVGLVARADDFTQIEGDPQSLVSSRQAPAGGKIEVPGLGTRTLVEGDDVTVRLPGDDVRLVVPRTPTTQPQTKPTTQPTPLEQPQPGQRVVYVTSSQGTISAQRNTFYTSAPGTRATVKGVDGIKFSDGDQNVTVYRIDFLGTSSSGHGVDVLAKNVRNVRFVDCSFSRFGDGIRLQHPRMTAAPRAEYIRDVVFSRCRVMDMTDTGDKGGHGMFACGVDGLTFDESLIDGAGMQRRSGYVHGIYAKEGATRVVVRRSYFRRCAGVGAQLRGPLIRYNDPDDGSDPGPIVEDNVFDDCAIGIMLNGPRGRETGNVIITGHHHSFPDNNGQGGTYDSVGLLESSNNLLVSGPRLGTGPKFAVWRNDDRPAKDRNKDGLLRWERTGPCNTTGEGNRADRGVVVDLTSFANRARDKMSAGLTSEIQRAVRRAAGE
jgi:hypothetical protein